MARGVFNRYGSSMYGGGSQAVLTELTALGMMDNYLIQSASVTFWRFRYARHTNFVFETAMQAIESGTGSSMPSNLLLERRGELVYWMYLVITRPGIYAAKREQSSFARGARIPQYVGCGGCSEEEKNYFGQYGAAHAGATTEDLQQVGEQLWKQHNYNASPDQHIYAPQEAEALPEDQPFVHYTNDFGHAFIRYAHLRIGTNIVYELCADFMHAWEELTCESSKRLCDMTGKYDNVRDLMFASSQDETLYVPLPFPHCLHSGNALSYITLSGNGIHLHFEWEQLENLICKSSEDVEVLKVSNNQPLTPADLRISLMTTYIHLDLGERNRYMNANFDTLWTETQTFYGTNNKSNQVTIDVKAQNNVIEYIWMAKRACHIKNKCHFDYSGIDGRDPIVEVMLKFNNDIRIVQEAQYFRKVQPRQHHKNIPQSYIYCYSFALHPEDAQPSGSVNQSTIANVQMIFTLQDGLENEDVQIVVFARTFNILRYTQGVCTNFYNLQIFNRLLTQLIGSRLTLYLGDLTNKFVVKNKTRINLLIQKHMYLLILLQAVFFSH